MPPTPSGISHSITTVHAMFNETYKRMDALSEILEYESYRNRASAIAVLIDALHHDYANHMQMEVDGS
jgi:archaellum biogenesis protein FlaJ (TadC family)